MTSFEYAWRVELLEMVLPDGIEIAYLNDATGRRVAKLKLLPLVKGL